MTSLSDTPSAMTTSQEPVRILFVCMGNICRSPLAECVFRHQVEARGVAHRFMIDSAGTGGWHAGNPPDPRVRCVAAENGIIVSGRARQVERADFERFDHILCMDHSNLSDLLRRGAPRDRTRLFLSWDPGAAVEEVPDPYYGGPEGFEDVFRLVDAACAALLDALIGGCPGTASQTRGGGDSPVCADGT